MSIQPEGSGRKRIPAEAIDRLWAIPRGALAGALSGAVIGGVAGRLLMRLVFLIDRDTESAQTDFGTIGEFTVGGSLTLVVLGTVAGLIGGVLYVGARRWLPWHGAARGAFFGLLIAFGPGVIALGEVDLQIAEPAVPIYLMFIALFLLYGLCVAWLTDTLHPEPAINPGPVMRNLTMGAQALTGVAILVMAVLTTANVQSNAGSCLSADQEGGCAVAAPD